MQEMACASCIGNCIVICGRHTSESSGANVVATMISLKCCIRPWESHNFVSVVVAAVFGVSMGGVTLMAVVWKVAALTGVGVVDVISMGPTVVGVVITTFGGITVVVVVVVVVVVLIAIVVAVSRASIGFLLEVPNFGVLASDEFSECFVASSQIGQHLAVRCGGRGKVCEGVCCVVDKGIHGVVGAMVACCLCCALGESPILVGLGEVDLESCPSFLGFGFATPFTAALWEHTGV